MEKKELGKSGIMVAPLAFGGNVFGWTLNQANSFTLLDRFIDAGYNLVDTADVYSRWVPGNHGGESESIIGKWMKARSNRSKVVIATKVGKEMGLDQKGLSAKYIRQAIEASLKRLQTEYIDLYQSHEDDSQADLEETMAAFAELVKEGKVRALGASNYSAARFAAALEVSAQNHFPRYESMQPLYNLYERSLFEQTLLPVCHANQISVIPYYALASGFLTGKYRSQKDLSKSPRGKNTQKFLTERGFAILAALDALSLEYQVSPATIAIAWLGSRPTVTAPIASATSEHQLEQLMLASQLKLSQASMEMLNKASA